MELIVGETENLGTGGARCIATALVLWRTRSHEAQGMRVTNLRRSNSS